MSTLQSLIYSKLSSDSDIISATEGHVFDEPPSGRLPELALQIGEETITTIFDSTGAVTLHEFEVSVIGREAGFAQLKMLIAPVCKALDLSPQRIGSAKLRRLNFLSSEAIRENGTESRRILMRFEALIDETSS